MRKKIVGFRSRSGVCMEWASGAPVCLRKKCCWKVIAGALKIWVDFCVFVGAQIQYDESVWACCVGGDAGVRVGV